MLYREVHRRASQGADFTFASGEGDRTQPATPQAAQHHTSSFHDRCACMLKGRIVQ